MKYCEFCGKPIESSEGCFCPEAQAKKNTIQSKHKSGKTLIFGISAVALLTLVLIAVFSIPFGKSDSSGGSSLGADASGTGSSGSLFDKSSKIDPFDYTEIKFTGYDTLGEIDIDFRITDIDDIIIGPEPEDMAAFTVWLARYEAFEGSVEYTCSEQEGLSNGDKVTITFTVTDDYKKYVKAGRKEITVSGLEEVTKFDFFSNIEVVFDGYSGDAKADINKLLDSDIMNTCSVSCSPRLALSAGDIVTVTINNAETLAKKYSVVPMEISKEYVVPNLPEYVSSADQIPENIIKDLINESIKKSEEDNITSAKEMLGIGVTWTYSEVMALRILFLKMAVICFLQQIGKQH